MIFILMVTFLSFSISSCNDPEETTITEKQEQEENTDETDPSTSKSLNLVVFYSWSGNTKHIAERIAYLTNAEKYEIRTVKSYPKDGYETADISMAERRTQHLPDLVDDFPDLSKFDTIYIGGPIWNAYMPTPLEAYLKIADFTGKTVIPFSTSQGSGQRGFQQDFEKMVRNPKSIGEYKDIRFPDNYSPETYSNSEIDTLLKDWLKNKY